MEIDDKQPYRFNIIHKFHIFKFTNMVIMCNFKLMLVYTNTRSIKAETDLQVI